MHSFAIPALATAVLGLCAVPLRAQETAPAAHSATQNWSQFLGDDVSARGAGASTLSFDRDNDLVYRVEVPPGQSSPCVFGDHIFLTGVDGKELAMFALDRKTGKELWRHTVPGPEKTEFMHPDAGIAMPTACCNGERVFFYLPSYGLVARTMDGDEVWKLELEDPTAANFGIGSSPRLWGDTLFLLRDGCPDRKLYALDEKTGEEKWSERRLRFRDCHTTPFIWENEQRTELIIASTGTVVSYDPTDGEELWRVEGLTPLVCTTPTASRERLYFAGWSTISAAGTDRLLAGMEEPLDLTQEERNDPKKLFEKLDQNGDGKVVPDEVPAGRAKTAFGFIDQDQDGSITLSEWVPIMRMPAMGKNLLISIKPGGDGDVSDTHVEWQVKRGIPYVASPLLYDGRIYLAKAGGILSCIDAKTGKPRFRRARLDDRSEYYATPVGVDGHVVLCAHGGTVFVLEAADELKIVRQVEFEEKIFATPAIAQGNVYLRTREALYAFGKGE